MSNPKTLFLKIKIINLADEAKLIRRHERIARVHADACLNDDYRDQHKMTVESLKNHRKTVVRDAARNTLLAYGYLRGRRYRQMEAASRTSPNWSEVERMIKKYGPMGALDGFEVWKSQEPMAIAA
jgi:hypothetical protein